MENENEEEMEKKLVNEKQEKKVHFHGPLKLLHNA